MVWLWLRWLCASLAVCGLCNAIRKRIIRKTDLGNKPAENSLKRPNLQEQKSRNTRVHAIDWGMDDKVTGRLVIPENSDDWTQNNFLAIVSLIKTCNRC
jgi:hypothetical protein